MFQLDSPADIEVALLLEQDVGDLFGMKEHVVLDVSGAWLGLGMGPLGDVSGEADFQVGQGAVPHKPLQLLPEEGTTNSSLLF